MADFKKALKNKQSKEMPKELKQKMAASVSGTGHSMVPQDHPQPTRKYVPDTEVDEVPSIAALIGDDVDRETMRMLVSTQITLKSQLTEIENKLEPIRARIKKMLTSYGIDKVECDGAKLTVYSTERKTVNAMKLIGAGVDEVIIQNCTDITVSSTLKITPPK